MEKIDKGIEPIYPCMYQRVGDGSKDFRAHKEGDPKEWRYPMGGLTKREYFAGLALQGILAGAIRQGLPKMSVDVSIDLALEYADKFLEELKKSEEK